MTEKYADFFRKLNQDITNLDDENQKNVLITRLSHAIIKLLALPSVTDLPAAKTAYIGGLTVALTALYGTGDRELTVDNTAFTSGGRSSRQTRRRRNGGKRNQRR